MFYFSKYWKSRQIIRCAKLFMGVSDKEQVLTSFLLLFSCRTGNGFVVHQSLFVGCKHSSNELLN